MLATAPIDEARQVLDSFATSAFLVEVPETGEFRFATLNRRHERLTGIDLAAFAGRRPADLLPVESAAQMQQACRRCVETREAVAYEERRDGPGGVRWWETVLVPLFDPQQHIVRLLGSSLDITARKQTEAQADLIFRHSPSIVSYLETAGSARPGTGPGEGGRAATGLASFMGQALQPLGDGGEGGGNPVSEALAGRETSFESEVDSPDLGRRSYFTTLIPDRAADSSVRGVSVMSTDITDRKRAEDALRESEANLSAIFNAAESPILLLDPAGRIVAVNAATARRHAAGVDQLLGRPVWELFSPDQQQAIAAEIEAAAGRKAHVRYRTRIGDRFFEEVVYPILDAEGAVMRLAGYALDITERIRAEQTLARRDDILEAVALAAERFLTTTSWEACTQEVIERLGWAAQAGRTYVFKNSVDADGVLRMSQMHEWAAPGVTPQIDNPLLQNLPYRAGGLGRWEKNMGAGEPVLDALEWLPRDEYGGLAPQGFRSIAVVPLFVGDSWWGFIGFEDKQPDRQWGRTEVEALKMAANILAAALRREQMDNALRQSEARYKLAVTAGPVTIFDWNLETGEVFLSDEFKAKLGYADHEIGSREEDWQRLIHPDDREQARAAMAEHLRGETDSYEVELRLLHRSGATRWFIVRGAVVARDRSDRPTLVAGTQTDVTERMQAAETLRQRSQALALANEELKSFTYIVSHDLRAPLITIEGFVAELEHGCESLSALARDEDMDAAALRAQVRSTVETRMSRAMGYITKAAETMNSQLAALLKLSRLGHRNMAFREVDSAEIVLRLLDRLAYQIRASETRVECGKLPRISTDPELLEVVLGNLLTNAVKYLRPGVPGHIVLWAEHAPAEWVFHIQDNGRGIDPKDQARVFEIFRRAGEDSVAGEGVGLTFARAAVRRAGGELWMKSNPGQGSTFSFALPSRETPEDAGDVSES
ncbi:MAG: PAS domain S-box protein [Alphaproteobacteria bacterium]|jgi:PAS domain S-box-containing protein|nr:PAS domain S-box protein [Alphaproteobacteria bacterium]